MESCSPPCSGLPNKWVQNWRGRGPPESVLKRNGLLTIILGGAVNVIVYTCTQHTCIHINSKSCAIPSVSELFISYVIR